MPASRAFLLVWFVVALGCASGGLPRQGWSRHRVGRVEFLSGASERQTAQLVDEFIKFRVVTGTLTSASSVEPRVPTKVFLFPDHRSYQRHVDVENSDGVFVSKDGEFTIALNGNATGSQELLFHEYTHLIVANTGQRYPIWYNEGFAELMSTMKFVGQDVQVARVSQASVPVIAEYNRWVPLPELIRGRVFEVREDRDRLHRHYVQAWLLVHYITFGAPEMAERIGPYVALYEQTGDPLRAFEEAFGVRAVALEKPIRDYVRQQKISFRVFPAAQFSFPAADEGPERLSAAATAVELARMCSMLGNEVRAQELRAAAVGAGQPDPLPSPESARGGQVRTRLLRSSFRESARQCGPSPSSVPLDSRSSA